MRPKDRWPEYNAAGAGVVALVLYFGFHNEAAAIGVMIAGVVILAWSYLDVTKR